MDSPRQLSRAETAFRYWDAPVRAAKTSLRYAREGASSDIDGDLAVLRAIAARRRLRRTLFFLAGGFLLRRYDKRRIDYASLVLRSLALAPHTPLKLALDLASTQSAKFMQKELATGSAQYENPWLEVEALVASGDRLKVVRVELLEYLIAQTGRTTKRQWTWSWEDRIELRFASPRAVPDASFAERVALPPSLRLTSLTGDPSSWRAVVRGGELDPRTATFASLEALAKSAAVASPLTSPTAQAKAARLATFGSRAFAYALVVPAAMAGLWAGIRTSDFLDRREMARSSPYETMLMENVWHVATEAMISAGIAVALLAVAVLLWILPRRAALRARLATTTPPGQTIGPYR